MSISLILEIESGLAERDLLQACTVAGALIANESSSIVFANSGLEVRVRSVVENDSVLAEPLCPSPVWRVGLRASLLFEDNKYDECKSDTTKLLETLAAQSAKRFVLSFQYENVYAVRDEHGLKILPESGLRATA